MGRPLVRHEGIGGKFVRQDAKWRDWVTADGKPAEGRERGFKAEPGRYHLYVSLACPWAHRTLIFRKLKKTGGRHLRLHRAPFHGQGRLDVPRRGRRDRRHALRPRFPAPDLHQGRSRLYGPRHGAGAVGQTRRDDRLQRIVRDHPHAELGLRRMGRRLARLLSGSPARRDRPRQRAGLPGDQQRRLSRRLRDDAGGL